MVLFNLVFGVPGSKVTNQVAFLFFVMAHFYTCSQQVKLLTQGHTMPVEALCEQWGHFVSSGGETAVK